MTGLAIAILSAGAMLVWSGLTNQPILPALRNVLTKGSSAGLGGGAGRDSERGGYRGSEGYSGLPPLGGEGGSGGPVTEPRGPIIVSPRPDDVPPPVVAPPPGGYA